MSELINLAGGLRIAEPLKRLLAYCREEYAYYDAVIQDDPDRLAPIDVIVTTAVNAFSVASARKIRAIHRELVQLEPLLAAVPQNLALADATPDDLSAVRRLLDRAVAVPGVLLAVATKVLHRKRPALIPMMDSVVVDYYRKSTGEKWLSAAWDDERRAADAGVRVMELFREDLLVAKDNLEAVTQQLAVEGFLITPVRALELLIWTEVESQGYYRDRLQPEEATATSTTAREDARHAPKAPAEAQLRAWADEFAREHALSSADLRINPTLLEDESDGFVLALSNGLVRIDGAGRFRMLGAAASKGPYNLFSRGERPTLNREYLIQIVAFAELVLSYGWAAKDVVFEHDALDIATFGAHGQVVVAVEAKRDEQLLTRMLEEIAAVTAESLAAASTNAIRKVAAIVRLRPQVFLAVAPGVRRVFDVDLDGALPRLTEREGIPDGGRDSYACRACGSQDDVRGGPEKDGVIPLHCDSCGYEWSRVPRRPCPRCGSGEVEVSGYQGWAYEDLEAARAADWHDAEWHAVDWDVYRCRQCRNVWQIGHRSA